MPRTPWCLKRDTIRQKLVYHVVLEKSTWPSGAGLSVELEIGVGSIDRRTVTPAKPCSPHLAQQAPDNSANLRTVGVCESLRPKSLLKVQM